MQDGASSTPGQGTEIPHAKWHSPNKPTNLFPFHPQSIHGEMVPNSSNNKIRPISGPWL